MMKDLKTAVNPEDVRTTVTANLDRAAKLNFAQVQQESHLEGKRSHFTSRDGALHPDNAVAPNDGRGASHFRTVRMHVSLVLIAV